MYWGPLTLQRSRSFGVICCACDFPEKRFPRRCLFYTCDSFSTKVSKVFPVTVHTKHISWNFRNLTFETKIHILKTLSNLTLLPNRKRTIANIMETANYRAKGGKFVIHGDYSRTYLYLCKFPSVTYCCRQAERQGPWTSCLNSQKVGFRLGSMYSL